MKKIFTDKAPKAIGPYSQAMVVGNLVYTSGQIPIDPTTGNIEANDIEGQTEQVCKNLSAVLEAAGSSTASVTVLLHTVDSDLVSRDFFCSLLV